MAEDQRSIASNIPIPDPSLLTTQQLRYETESLRQTVKQWIDSLQLLHEARMDGRDAQYAEKFQSVQIQFKERDVRTEQTASQVKLAVDAALQAQKEATGEANKSFTKQIDALGTTIRTAISGLDLRLGELRDRLTRIEGAGLGREHASTAGQTSRENAFSIIAIIIGIGAAIVAYMKV